MKIIDTATLEVLMQPGTTVGQIRKTRMKIPNQIMLLKVKKEMKKIKMEVMTEKKTVHQNSLT